MPGAGNPQAFNRYSYTKNNPLRYIDPTGHINCIPEIGECDGGVIEIGGGGGNFDLQNDPQFQQAAADQATYYSNLQASEQASIEPADAAANVDTANVSDGDDILKSGQPALQNQNTSPDVGTHVYRVYGDDPVTTGMPGSGPYGRSWTPVDPSTVANPRDSMGLPSGGPSGSYNTGQFVIEGDLTDNSGIIVRSALPLDGNSGGLLEYIIPNPLNQVNITGVSGVNPPY